LAPILARSGLQPGADFRLAYSPERVLPGHILREMIDNARVIGGIDRASAEAGRDLYAVFVRGDILLTDATTAEMVKLMENTYRDVNIALANEFAGLAEAFGVDVWQAIELANRHPRVQILRPGPGVGGHCIGIDPWFLVEAAPEMTPLIKQARLVNDGRPAHVVEVLRGQLGGQLAGRRLAALGLAYKSDVDDLRQSPAIAIVQALVEAGAEVTTYEPMAAAGRVEGATPAENLDQALRGADALVLLVDHKPFLDLDPAHAASLLSGRQVFDMRGALDRPAWRQAGFELTILGVGRDGG
jgi:UDP-N-acetyl-D-mannosaminuronic acid dehydrogenase